MVIMHNMSAISAEGELKITGKNKSMSVEKLSTGYKINRAADDAANLAVSETMRGQIRGLDQAGRNSKDGQSLISTADAAMNEMHAVLQRMRELCVQGANDVNTSEDRESIQMEIEALNGEIDRITDQTEFNTMKIFKGMYARTVRYLSGASAGSIISSGNQPAGVNTSGLALVLGVTNMTTTGKLSESFKLDNNCETTGKTNTGQSRSSGYAGKPNTEFKAAAYMDFSKAGSDYRITDLVGSGFNSSCVTCNDRYNVKFVDNSTKSTSSGYGYYVDKSYQYGGISHTLCIDVNTVKSGDDIVKAIVDAAKESGFNDHFTQFAYNRNQAGTLWVYDNGDYIKGYDHSNPKWGNFEPVVRKPDGQIELDENKTTIQDGRNTKTNYELSGLVFQVGANSKQLVYARLPVLSSQILGTDAIEVSDFEHATNALHVLDGAIDTISYERVRMGSIANRLDHSYDYAKTASENVQSSESKIRDTDMADEMVAYSSYNIIEQAGTSILAQANSSQDTILQMLQ